jgi:hypothetical protein
MRSRLRSSPGARRRTTSGGPRLTWPVDPSVMRPPRGAARHVYVYHVFVSNRRRGIPSKDVFIAYPVVTLVVASATGSVAADGFGNPDLCGDGGQCWSMKTPPSIPDVFAFQRIRRRVQ